MPAPGRAAVPPPRGHNPLPLAVSIKGTSIVVRAQQAWLNRHPLSDFTLRAEDGEWSKVGFSFELLET